MINNEFSTILQRLRQLKRVNLTAVKALFNRKQIVSDSDNYIFSGLVLVMTAWIKNISKFRLPLVSLNINLIINCSSSFGDYNIKTG